MGLALRGAGLLLAGPPLIRPFALAIGPGDTVALMGASGTGKSSLLALIAGDLAPPFAGLGSIRLDGKAIDALPPERRGIGRLFQDDLLFPHLTVGENLLFGMPRGVRAERLASMRDALAEAGLADFAARAPHTLSGGQRQRVALMRALAARPRAMLLDEPFGRLDQDLRQAMRHFVFGHIAARAISCLLVTHDRADAPPGGRVLTIRGGKVTDD